MLKPIIAFGLIMVLAAVTYAKSDYDKSIVVLDGIMKVLEPGTVRGMEIEIGEDDVKLYYNFPQNRFKHLSNGKYHLTVTVTRIDD